MSVCNEKTKLNEVMKLNKAMKLDETMKLYLVTDRTWLNDKSLANQVEETLKAGATFVQLREKDMPYEKFLEEAREIKKLTDKYKVPFVINDDVEIAVAIDSDGVHIGQSDKTASEVRELIGKDKILGVSACTVEQAVLAEQQGADYIGVGAIFATSTKNDADIVTLEILRGICKAVNVPVVAIGGICEENILQLCGTGIKGVAVISALLAQPDITAATEKLLRMTEKL